MGICKSSSKNKKNTTENTELTNNIIHSFLKDGLTTNDFDIEKSIIFGNGGFGDILKIGLKSDPSKNFALKVMMVNSKDEKANDEMKNEIYLLEQISQLKIKPQCFPEYCGYFYENNPGHQTVYNICFKFLPYTLRQLIKEHKNSGKKFEPNLS